MSGPARFAAAPDAIEAAAADVAAAAAAIRALHDHPGVLAGQAADSGDGGLSAALVAFAASWDWGLQVVGGETDRWAHLLTAAAATYRAVERSVVPASLGGDR